MTHVEQPSNWVPTGLVVANDWGNWVGFFTDMPGPCKVLDKPLGMNINKKLGIEARVSLWATGSRENLTDAGRHRTPLAAILASAESDVQRSGGALPWPPWNVTI